MKFILFFLVAVLSNVSHAGATSCAVTNVQTKLLARSWEIFKGIETSFNFPLCATTAEEEAAVNNPYSPQCVSASAVISSIMDLKWNPELGVYVSKDYLNWECAASVQCWAWLEADCEGNFSLKSEHED